METPAQIIEKKGGPAAFAEAIGKTPGAVRVMKCRNRFPRKVWPEIVRAFPDLTLDRLEQLERRAA